jgi:hypothetical protein
VPQTPSLTRDRKVRGVVPATPGGLFPLNGARIYSHSVSYTGTSDLAGRALGFHGAGTPTETLAESITSSGRITLSDHGSPIVRDVPEPGAALLTAVGAAIAAVRRRRLSKEKAI